MAEYIAHRGGRVAGISFLMHGAVHGRLLMVIPPESVGILLDMLVPRQDPRENSLSALELSALMEAGNIFVSACIDRIGDGLRLTLVPSPPCLDFAPCGEIIHSLLEDSVETGELLLLSETDFRSADERLTFQCLFFPTQSVLDRALEVLDTAGRT